jgi:hypothetical protein
MKTIKKHKDELNMLAKICANGDYQEMLSMILTNQDRLKYHTIWLSPRLMCTKRNNYEELQEWSEWDDTSDIIDFATVEKTVWSAVEIGLNDVYIINQETKETYQISRF